MTVTPDDKIIEQLGRIGLSSEAANIYIFLLKVGTERTKNTAFQVAKSLSLPRSTVYLNLDRLMSSKLVSLYKINNVSHFLAEHPSRMQNDLQEKQRMFQDLLPTLESLRSSARTHSSVRTYTGNDGVKLVFDEIFSKEQVKDVRQIFTVSNTLLSKILPRGFPEKLDKIKKRHQVHTRMILVPAGASEISSVYKEDSNREIRLMPENYYFDGSLCIYGNKVAFFSLADNEIYSVIIESKTIVAMIKSFFMCTWDLLQKKAIS